VGERLKGRVAIVTGAGRGIGRGEALALASEGAIVLVNDLGGAVDGSGAEHSPADDVVAEIKKMGGQAAANYDSVTDFDAAERMIKQAIDTFGHFDTLVNNAGVLRDRMIFNMSEDDWDTIMAIHLKGHFNFTKHACVLFRQQRSGVIVNTSSTSGLGNIGQTNYAAAKEGIVGMTRTVAREMGRYGVRCNAIRPVAATRLTLSDDMKQRFARAGDAGMAQLAMMEKQVPEEIGPFVAWLCTDEAANINGRNFLVRSGHIGLYSEPEEIATVETDKSWSVDLVAELVPKNVTAKLVNEWPPQPPKE
jgi:NAD(P)-dependent dehydrogenase (short-subunit alcohol dehydrogenase family)